MIRTLLAQEQYSVVTARDGLEAINILRIEDMHLVITDLRMPGADGIEVLKYAARNNPDTAVVILTAYGTLDTTLDAIKGGAYDYLTKPFKVQEIITLTEKAYKQALLMEDNRELRKHLRDTFHDIEFIKAAAGCNKADIASDWIERVERLKSLNVFSGQEAALLKERLAKRDGNRKDINSR